jgi:maltodextrin utilization protein YvdJ
MAIEDRYKGNWQNVKRDCLLCEMEKKTEWHLETKDWVIAEKLGGGPFVVYKKHKESLSADEWEDMTRVVGKLYDEFDIRVMMSLVEDHWHGHIVTDEDVDLSDE